MSPRMLCAIACSMIIIAPARPHSTKSTCRSFRRRIGAGTGCIRAAISRAILPPAPIRNGSKCTAIRISRISTATTAPACRIASSVISSRARRLAGTSSRRSRSTYAGRANGLSGARRTNGRSRARDGPSFISMRATARWCKHHQAVRHRLRSRRRATGSLSSPLPWLGKPRSPALWPRRFSSPHRQPTPIFSWCSGSLIRRARRWCSSAPMTLARP